MRSFEPGTTVEIMTESKNQMRYRKSIQFQYKVREPWGDGPVIFTEPISRSGIGPSGEATWINKNGSCNNKKN
jgi:hypothetical protein